MDTPCVAVSVFGRFHAFDLARQLHELGALTRLITTYPRWMTARWQIPARQVSSILSLELLVRGWNQFGISGRWQSRARLWFCERFDRAASRCLPLAANVCVGWSSYSLQTLRRAKSHGMKTVLERGSSHIIVQTQIMEEEYRRWGRVFSATPESIRDRELQEYAEADRIAVPSIFAKRSFLGQGIAPQKLIHIPYGVSLEEFFPVPRVDDTFRVIYCGRLSLHKGLPYLLQAFRELRLPKAELWLIGQIDPEMRPLLAGCRNHRVIVKGSHPQSTLRWFYSQCSVFCLPSVDDGFGMVIPQAMACGLPVIHTTNTGGGDIVEERVHGFEVPIRDVNALKEKILYLYENPAAREEMGRRARARAIEALSWRRYGDAVLAAYRGLLNGA